MSSWPKVSIMMPAYNVEPWVDAAITSTLNQTYENWELCFVDDHSQDATWERVCQYNDPRIKRRRLAVHGTCPVARNACMEMMTGEIFVRQDADDWQDARRIELQVRSLLDDPQTDINTCRIYAVDGEGCISYMAHSGPMVPSLYEVGENAVSNMTIVAWRRVYEAIGPFNVHQLAGSDGTWNFMSLRHGFRWGFVDCPLYYYRQHPAQLSKAYNHLQRANRAVNIERHAQWKAKLTVS